MSEGPDQASYTGVLYVRPVGRGIVVEDEEARPHIDEWVMQALVAGRLARRRRRVAWRRSDDRAGHADSHYRTRGQGPQLTLMDRAGRSRVGAHLRHAIAAIEVSSLCEPLLSTGCRG